MTVWMHWNFSWYLFESKYGICLNFGWYLFESKYANDRMTVAGVHHSALTDSSLAALANYLINGGRQLMDRPPNKYMEKYRERLKLIKDS